MSQENSENNDNSNLEIMNYLISKLESRYDSILKFNNLIESYDTSERFFTLRNDLKLLFNDLSEDFKQGIFAIKALSNQNKKILEEIKQKDINNKKTLDELNKYVSENKNLKNKVINDKNISNKKNIEDSDDDDSDDSDESEEIIKEIKKDKKKSNDNNIDNNNDNIKNKYDMKNLSKARDIMANMNKNKIKIKQAIAKGLANNQNFDDN